MVSGRRLSFRTTHDHHSPVGKSEAKGEFAPIYTQTVLKLSRKAVHCAFGWLFAFTRCVTNLVESPAN